MTFLNPALLWGMLAVAVPIALHFWHQQRAAPMPWAMLRWLETPGQPPRRGIQFNNWWLLLVRCLALLCLVMLLARPSVMVRPGTETGQRLHLVEPNPAVVRAFRFELTQAQARHEPLWWASTPTRSVTSLDDVPTGFSPNLLQWQAALTSLSPASGGQLHTYLANSPGWAEAPPLQVPVGFVLHATPFGASGLPQRVLALPNGRRLLVSVGGQLQVVARPPVPEKVVATAPLQILLTCRQPAHRATLTAALAALKAVYELDYSLDIDLIKAKHYDWVLTDCPVPNPASATLYTVVGQMGDAHRPSVTYLPDLPTPQTSSLVAAGQLPEWLATQLLQHLGLSLPPPLSQAALARLFVPTANTTPPPVQTENWLQTAFLTLFLSLLLAERCLALPKGL